MSTHTHPRTVLRPRRELLFRKVLYGSRLIKIENRQFSVGLNCTMVHIRRLGKILQFSLSVGIAIPVG